jgi:hypothetical protein
MLILTPALSLKIRKHDMSSLQQSLSFCGKSWLLSLHGKSMVLIPLLEGLHGLVYSFVGRVGQILRYSGW